MELATCTWAHSFSLRIVGRRSETISLRLCLSWRFKNEGKFYVLYYEYEIFMRNEGKIKYRRYALVKCSKDPSTYLLVQNRD